jgi:hypothetical protein
MTGNEQTSDRGISSGRFLPVLGLLAAGLVHSVLPHGAFGPYDFAARAAVAGTVAGVTTLLLFALTRRRAAR